MDLYGCVPARLRCLGVFNVDVLLVFAIGVDRHSRLLVVVRAAV